MSPRDSCEALYNRNSDLVLPTCYTSATSQLIGLLQHVDKCVVICDVKNHTFSQAKNLRRSLNWQSHSTGVFCRIISELPHKNIISVLCVTVTDCGGILLSTFTIDKTDNTDNRCLKRYLFIQ